VQDLKKTLWNDFSLNLRKRFASAPETIA